MPDLLLHGGRLWGGGLADVVIRDGRIAALADAGAVDARAVDAHAAGTRVDDAHADGSASEARADAVVRRLVDHDIAVMTHAPAGATPFPPVRLLAERGVRLCTGSDGVRDAWSPLNTGDMLERAYLIAYRSGFRDDAGLELALHMATYGGAQVMGCAGYGLAVGAPADLVLVQAENGAEAVALHPVRRCVLKAGRVVARDGHALIGPAEAAVGGAAAMDAAR